MFIPNWWYFENNNLPTKQTRKIGIVYIDIDTRVNRFEDIVYYPNAAPPIALNRMCTKLIRMCEEEQRMDLSLRLNYLRPKIQRRLIK